MENLDTFFLGGLNSYKSFNLFKDVFGLENITTQEVYLNLIVCRTQNNLGDYNISEAKKKILFLYIKEFGNNHPRTAFAYSSLASSLIDIDEKNAFEYLKKSLKIQNSILGKNHTDTAKTYQNLSGYYLNKDVNKAYNYLKKSIDILKNNLYSNHAELIQLKLDLESIKRIKSKKSHIVSTYINESGSHRLLDEYDEGLIYYMEYYSYLKNRDDYIIAYEKITKAVELWKSCLPSDNPDLKNAKYELERIKSAKDILVIDKKYNWKRKIHKKIYTTYLDYESYSEYRKWYESYKPKKQKKCKVIKNIFPEGIIIDEYYFYKLFLMSKALDSEAKLEIFMTGYQNLEQSQVNALIKVFENELETMRHINIDYLHLDHIKYNAIDFIEKADLILESMNKIARDMLSDIFAELL